MSSFEPVALAGRDATDFVPIALGARDGFAGAGLSRDERHEALERVRRDELAAAVERARAEGAEAARAEDREPFRAALAALAELRRDYLVQSREGIVELALAIAERVVRHALAEQADLLAAFVEHAVATVAADGPLEVRVSPIDCERLRAGEAEDAAVARERGYVLVADPALARGDVVVEGASSELDGRIERLLGIVRASLLPVDRDEIERGGADAPGGGAR